VREHATQFGIKHIASPHNEYIGIADRSGFISLGLFCWIVFLVLKRSYLLYKTAPNPFTKAMGLGVFSSLVGVFFISEMTQTNFVTAYSAYFLWFLIGTVESLHRVNRFKTSKTASSRKPK
jgi:hypothetical protein